MRPLEWDVENVCCWLCTVELGCLQEKFRRNKVDGAGLLLLTREELRDELQIESYIDRKRLWTELVRLHERDAEARGTPNAFTREHSNASSHFARRESDVESRHSHLSQSLSGLVSPISPPLGVPVGAGAASETASNPSSTDLSSEWSAAAFVDKQKYNLRLTDDARLSIAVLSKAYDALILHLGGSCTVALLAKFAARHQAVTVGLLCRLLYGLVGKKTPSESVIKHDALHTSAVTLLRAYGVGGTGPVTLDGAAQTLRRQPMLRFVRDAFRVCEEVAPPKSAHAVIAQTDVELFIQIFELADVILALPQPRPAPAEAITSGGAASGGEAVIHASDLRGPRARSRTHDSDAFRASEAFLSRPVDLPDLTGRVRGSQELAEAVLAGLLRALEAPAPASRDAALPIAAVSVLAGYGVAAPHEGKAAVTLRECAGHLRHHYAQYHVARILNSINVAMGAHTERAFVDRYGFSRFDFAAAAAPVKVRGGKERPIPEALALKAQPSDASLLGGSLSSAPATPYVDGLEEPAAVDARRSESTASSRSSPPAVVWCEAGFRVGDRVQVAGDAELVEAACRGNPWVGFDPDMLRYVGAQGRVKRCSDRDVKAHKVQVVHDDATWTWPFDVVKKVASKNPILEYTFAAADDAAPCPVHAAPTPDAAVIVHLPPGSTIHVAETRAGWLRCHGGGWVAAAAPSGGEWRCPSLPVTSPPTLVLDSAPPPPAPAPAPAPDAARQRQRQRERGGYYQPPPLSLVSDAEHRQPHAISMYDDEVPL